MVKKFSFSEKALHWTDLFAILRLYKTKETSFCKAYFFTRKCMRLQIRERSFYGEELLGKIL